MKLEPLTIVLYMPDGDKLGLPNCTALVPRCSHAIAFLDEAGFAHQTNLPYCTVTTNPAASVDAAL